MKKNIFHRIFVVLLGLFVGFFVNQCFGYDVLIHDSQGNVIDVISVADGETAEITLNGNWTKNGDHYSFNDGYSSTKVYYTDGYGKEKTITLNNDIYFNGEYSLGYTGTNQYLQLSENNCGDFDGYMPTFEVTGSIDPNNEFTGNVFSNFADNALQVLLSNIPNYIQYVVIIFLLFFILGVIGKIRKRR